MLLDSIIDQTDYHRNLKGSSVWFMYLLVKIVPAGACAINSCILSVFYMKATWKLGFIALWSYWMMLVTYRVGMSNIVLQIFASSHSYLIRMGSFREREKLNEAFYVSRGMISACNISMPLETLFFELSPLT